MLTFEDVHRTARQLPPIKQIQLIQELLQELQQGLPQPAEEVPAANQRNTPTSALNDLATDFWSVHDVVEEPNFYVPRRIREARRWREHEREHPHSHSHPHDRERVLGS